MQNQDSCSGRDMKRRVLRYQHHELPRRSRLPLRQRITLWMMMAIAVAMVMVGKIQ